MSLASWFRVPQLHRIFVLIKTGGWDRRRACRRQPCRRPARSRPFMEVLEDRTLLDGSSGLLGGANNLALNGAAASSGNVLPVVTSGEHAVSVSGLDASGRSAETVSDALLAQDQPNSQFRLFGVNSQGESTRLIQQTTANILRDAFGFGSGTQPNAPWAPAAYNLGLANHQYSYPSQTDNGFFSAPPWYHHIAYVQLGAEPLQDGDPESLLLQHSNQEPQRRESSWLDEETSEDTRDAKSLTKQLDADPVVVLGRRGEPLVEEALFTEPLHTLIAATLAYRL